MAVPMEELRQVKSEARITFGQVPGVTGFGIGDGTLRIYVRDSATRRILPETYKDVPVEFVITGDITAASFSENSPAPKTPSPTPTEAVLAPLPH